jgi:hypothetical protein
VICNHPDWCTYTDDGANCCMRIENDKPMRNGGWLHRETEYRYIPPAPVKLEPEIDFVSMWRAWSNATSVFQVNTLAEQLNVSRESLESLNCVWAGSAFAFPMRDHTGKMIGIRLRDPNGHKYAVKGSRQGLFLVNERPQRTTYLLEGPTDTAAALTLGLNAFGRPACLGQEDLIRKYLKRYSVERLVIVTDNDEPGIRGAVKLQDSLPILSCVYVPPTKDLRELVRLGGSKELVESGVKDLVWSRPNET